MEEKHALRVQLESMVEDLWGQFQQALKNYQETTGERKKAFEELKAKDEKSANEIEMQMRKLQRISVSAGPLVLLILQLVEATSVVLIVRVSLKRLGSYLEILMASTLNLAENVN